VRLPRPLLAALLTFLVVCQPAAASDTVTLAADASRTGEIALLSAGPEGTRVEFFERVAADKRVPLGTATVGPTGLVVLARAARWRCDRVVRNFAARGTTPAGEVSRLRYSLRTPSCRNRLSIHAPRKIALGAAVGLRVRDTWRLGGVRARVCASRAGGKAICRPVSIARGAGVAERSVRPGRRGVWRFEVRLGRHRSAVRVGVGVAGPPRRTRPLVLATGDSTIQGIDGNLADRLPPRVRVVPDFYPASGITRPVTAEWPYWPDRARRQALERLPRLTVVSIGAVDGHPMTVAGIVRVECCGEVWVEEYARRVREMMVAYARGGSGRVLWLTLPRPRTDALARVTAAVNASVRQAAAGYPHARVVSLDRVFTPGWSYRDHMRAGAGRVRVRESDGIHLTAPGTRLAARKVAAAARNWPGTL
jgi:lysophospholipase L1-like esterase